MDAGGRRIEEYFGSRFLVCVIVWRSMFELNFGFIQCARRRIHPWSFPATQSHVALSLSHRAKDLH